MNLNLDVDVMSKFNYTMPNDYQEIVIINNKLSLAKRVDKDWIYGFIDFIERLERKKIDLDYEQ